MGYTKKPGMVRLDIYTPDGRWHATDELDMTNFRESATADEAVLGAVISQGRWNPGEWVLSVPEPWHRQDIPVLIQSSGVRAETPPVEEALRDLVATLNLYVGHHTWTKLTTPQKELFADVVDRNWSELEPGDGALTERWWR